MIGKKTAEHYIWGENCDGWPLVKNKFLSVIHERMPPATSEVRHYHEKASQFFFVLKGAATLEIAGKREILHEHEGAEIPPGVPHQLFNESGKEIEFLVISRPPVGNDRVLIEDIKNESVK